MNTTMRTICYHFKIFNTIICSISVFMMNKFFFSKISTQVFFHYKTVFKYIVTNVFMGMIGLKNKTISIRNIFSPFPKRTTRSFIGAPLALSRAKKIFISTIFTKGNSSYWPFKFLSTEFADYSNLCYSYMSSWHSVSIIAFF